MSALARSVGLVLAVCVTVRLGSWLIEPIMPGLIVVAAVLLLVLWLMRPPRYHRGPPDWFH